jgi:hypothetical protein
MYNSTRGIVPVLVGSLVVGSVYTAVLFYSLRSLCFFCLGHP